LRASIFPGPLLHSCYCTGLGPGFSGEWLSLRHTSRWTPVMPTRYAMRPVNVWVRLGKIVFHFSVSSVAQVQGLCGTFTWKQQDDFLTPAGDIETSVTAFASKFQVSGDGRCPLVDKSPLFCSSYSQHLTFTEAACAILHGHAFQVLGCPLCP
jgi:hypothetical protein